jgi:hypothetical protein
MKFILFSLCLFAILYCDYVEMFMMELAHRLSSVTRQFKLKSILELTKEEEFDEEPKFKPKFQNSFVKSNTRPQMNKLVDDVLRSCRLGDRRRVDVDMVSFS